MADDEIGVEHVDIAGHRDVAGLDRAGAGGGKLEPLGAFAFHLERDLLHVEDDIGHVLAHAGERREFVQHVLDLDRGDGRTLKRSEEHTSELQSLMRNSYAVFCLKKKNKKRQIKTCITTQTIQYTR